MKNTPERRMKHIAKKIGSEGRELAKKSVMFKRAIDTMVHYNLTAYQAMIELGKSYEDLRKSYEAYASADMRPMVMIRKDGNL